MRRISIDEVRAACEATGYRLVARTTLNHVDKCGCPLGVIVLMMSEDGASLDWDSLGLEPGYSSGFVAGFDMTDVKIARWCHDTFGTESYKIGHADGTAIRLALLPA